MISLRYLPFILAPFTAVAASYHISSSIPIGGSGSYDYIRYDAASHLLFVSHQTEVDVVDAQAATVVGKVTGLHGVHGISVVHALNRAFVTNGLDGTLSIVDLKTLATVGSVKTGGQKPDAIEYDEPSGLLLVSNGHSNSVSIIEASSGTVKHLVSVSGNPESIAFDGEGHAFVNLESRSTVAKIDLASGVVLSEWTVGPGEGPTGLGIDRSSGRLFVSCGGNEKLIVLDSKSGKQVAVLGIGDDSDAVGFNPSNHRIFSSNRDGTLTVIEEQSPDRFAVVQTVQTQFGAKTLALDPSSDTVFLPVATLTAGPDEDHPGPAVPNTFKILVITP